jgi:DNA polymerase elongation subunit (family B)
VIKTSDPMKRLILDIETSPILGKVWGLRNQFLGLDQIEAPSQMLSFAAKWYGGKSTAFYAGYTENDPGIDPFAQQAMVTNAWNLVNEADVIIHFNGKNFDMRHLNREFAEQGLGPPSPYQYIDLLKVARKNFFLPSYKLEYILRWLGEAGKIKHTGFGMWNQVIEGDATARKLFKRYNIGDVVKTETVYDHFMPWIDDHPNMQLFVDRVTGVVICPVCGSANNHKEGSTPKGRLTRVQRYLCDDCGKWFQGKEAIARAEER